MKTSLKFFTLAAMLSCLLLYCSKDSSLWETFTPETDEEPTASQVNGYIFKPALVPATAERVQQLKVPTGFRVAKFADSLGKPRMLAVSSQGFVYVSDREAGTVMLLQDANSDGTAERMQVVANLPQAHGVAVQGAKLYIVTVTEVFTADIMADGSLGQPVKIIENLPDGGQHPNRTLAFGPDGKLYISIGSTCNSCPEPNTMNATIVQANADGSGLKVFAKGLRNTIGFGWRPGTTEMWGMDHGIDWLGDDAQIEELNLLQEGKIYGWPYIYGEGKYNPGDRPPGDTTYKQYLDLTTLPVLGYQAHAAPMQMAFYTGDMFPAEYQGDAFIAMRGSWNRSKPVGYKVVRLHFEDGKPVRFDDFLTGFLVDNDHAHFGRLAGVAVHADGSLLVSDDTNGVVYRVSVE